VVDLGTGDGRSVLARARREPGAVVVGIDASAAAMAESSLRAARPARKGGLPNALFVVAAAERPPAELAGIAAEVSVLFPWGSLLRGALALDDAGAVAAGIAGLVAPGGVVRMLLSIDPHDRLSTPPPTAADRRSSTERWARHGLDLCVLEPVGAAEAAASGSTWARRLRAGHDRAIWRVELRRQSRTAELSGAARIR
jgi:16S rRNA (adenine(1408)-N(1))-methyltransferase